MENQTIFAYFYKNVTGKCFSESPFDVKINDKILVLLSQRYFSKCIINLDENEFNRLITIPNLTFSEEGIIGKGCLRPVFNKYIIWNNGTFAVIRNKEEFKKFFAPIETTGSYPKYDINISKNDFVILFQTDLKYTFLTINFADAATILIIRLIILLQKQEILKKFPGR